MDAIIFAIKFLIFMTRVVFDLGRWFGEYLSELAVQKTEAAAEAKLMEAKTTHALGQAIESCSCPDCGAENEIGEATCFACGADLEPAVAQDASDFDIWSILTGIPPWVYGLGAVILMGIICSWG